MTALTDRQAHYVHMKRPLERDEILAARYERYKKKKAKKTVSPEKIAAKKGQFSYDSLHGFKLVEMDYTVPDKKTRKRRRSQFNAVRKEFLKYIGENCEEALRNLGMNDEQIKQVKNGNSPSGYNVHHKLPIHGGGRNEFENLILMPIPPHNDLHHKIIDPQIQSMMDGDSKKVKIPWSDNMVYVPPQREDPHNRHKNKPSMTIEMNTYIKSMTAAKR